MTSKMLCLALMIAFLPAFHHEQARVGDNSPHRVSIGFWDLAWLGGKPEGTESDQLRRDVNQVVSFIAESADIEIVVLGPVRRPSEEWRLTEEGLSAYGYKFTFSDPWGHLAIAYDADEVELVKSYGQHTPKYIGDPPCHTVEETGNHVYATFAAASTRYSVAAVYLQSDAMPPGCRWSDFPSFARRKQSKWVLSEIEMGLGRTLSENLIIAGAFHVAASDPLLDDYRQKGFQVLTEEGRLGAASSSRSNPLTDQIIVSESAYEDWVSGQTAPRLPIADRELWADRPGFRPPLWAEFLFD